MDRFAVNAMIDREFGDELEALETALQRQMLVLRQIDARAVKRLDALQGRLLRLTDRMQDRAVDIALLARMTRSDNEQEQEKEQH